MRYSAGFPTPRRKRVFVCYKYSTCPSTETEPSQPKRAAAVGREDRKRHEIDHVFETQVTPHAFFLMDFALLIVVAFDFVFAFAFAFAFVVTFGDGLDFFDEGLDAFVDTGEVFGDAGSLGEVLEDLDEVLALDEAFFGVVLP